MQIFINSYGSYLHVKEDMFEIRVKSEQGKGSIKPSVYKTNHISAKKITSFVISKGSAISTDAIALAVKYNIDIVIVENNGHPFGRFWHSKLGSTTKIRKKQLEFSLDSRGLDWTKSWIELKLTNQIEYITDLIKHRKRLADELHRRKESITNLRNAIIELDGNSVDDIAEILRGLEGSAGRHYFTSLGMAIPEGFKFDKRSFRPAKDPFNAMLNYAYGILYSRIERALMLAGLDPYIGFLHRDDYNMKSMVFDFIEPYRIYAERCVFGLFSRKKVNHSWFQEIPGGISLNKEGKPVLVENFVNYLDEDKIRYNGRNLSRSHCIQLDAHSFANKLIK